MKTDTSSPIAEKDSIRVRVRERYGSIAGQEAACGCACGPACCTPGAGDVAAVSGKLGYSPEELAAVPEGSNLGLGCGNPHALAALRPGQTVLDLGSGAGFDVFLAARAVGPAGRVIGVDMTPEMIAKARANAVADGHGNVEFRLGEIECLPVSDASVDAILSNCVINLSPDKAQVFREAFRVLKPGGHVSISDIVALRPLPEDLKADFTAYTGCVAGAATVEELHTMLIEAGFAEVRIDIREESRAFIDGWLPGRGAGEFVASAAITARKPESSGAEFRASC